MIYNEIYIYDEKSKILMLTNEKQLNYYLKKGFKRITDEEAKALPNYDKIKEILDSWNSWLSFSFNNNLIHLFIHIYKLCRILLISAKLILINANMGNKKIIITNKTNK